MIQAATFSITARCKRTGMLGVAVATRLPAVGALCPFAKAGTGAICSQARLTPYFGINGLKLLQKGFSAQETLERLLAQDRGRVKRQVAIVDSEGKSAAFTGEAAEEWKGHLAGPNYAVAGNRIVGPQVVKAMADIFQAGVDEELPERLLRALEAGQAAGGDKLGKQSAALYVVHIEDYGYVDLRVDEHPDPVAELRRIYEVARAELYPFRKLYPTKANPAGDWDTGEWDRLKRKIAADG